MPKNESKIPAVFGSNLQSKGVPLFHQSTYSDKHQSCMVCKDYFPNSNFSLGPFDCW